MRKWTCSLTLLGLVALAAPWRADGREPQVPDLKVEAYTLPNGLEVILHEDHTTPVVAVDLWYGVGSKDERPGRTGFAHLFEHLMFQGSEHHDHEYFAPLEQLGAQINGSTSTDRTNYFEVVPSNVLERALWLEADRMGFLLPALSRAKLDNQRDVVKNERRQRVDNVPYGQAQEALLAALYPDDHPYHHSVIGSMADLSAARLEDVSAFFRAHYTPNNASLCLAGDFDPGAARRLVERYFGPIPRGPDRPRPEPRVATLDGPKHLMMTDRVSLARAQLVWPTVAVGADDEAALDVLAAVLGQLENESRLFRALMYDRRLASSVRASHRAEALAGTFSVSLTARPGRGLDELVALADAEIARLKAEGPTADEVAKAQNVAESRLVLGLQAVLRKAELLNGANVERGDPLAYKAELRDLFAVTLEDVKRVANRYLTEDRIRQDVTPGPAAERAPEVAVAPGAEAAPPAPSSIKDTFDRGTMPEVGPPPAFRPPAIARRRLSNGLEILVAERHNLPILSLQLVLKGGETLVPEDKAGLASLAAAMLTSGTESRDALQLAGALAEIGARLDAGGGLESSHVSLTTLTAHAGAALGLFADVLLHPSFPETELERLRLQRLSALARRHDDASRIAGDVFPRILYGRQHPYGRPDLGTPETVRALTRDDVVAFYRRLYRPNNAALIAVGDTTPDAIAAALEDALKDWEPGEPVAATLPEIPPPPDRPLTVYLVDRPGAAQSVLALGRVGVPRRTPDYFPLTVMNTILGGQFTSRINLNLREEKGYTYGARSSFGFRLGPGPFRAGGSVQTAATKDALVELVKEFRDITGNRPVTEAELDFARGRMILGFPARFETTRGVADALSDLVTFGLPDDYYATYQDHLRTVTRDEVTRVSGQYLDPDHMVILVVGDRAAVEPALKTLPYADVINGLDPDGAPLPSGTPAAGSSGGR